MAGGMDPGSDRASTRAPSAATGGRGTILVVEDDLDFRDLLVEHLVSSSRRVSAAANGAEALSALANGGDGIGLVLLDLRMPVMDGYELCRQLEGSPEAIPAVPIVVMTAESETRGIERCRWVVGVLVKPIDLRKLDALIDAHVRG